MLFELDGALRVLLTTRSKSLRSHPGQTALPGGKIDPSDKNVIATAVSHATHAIQQELIWVDQLREANEEVSLPLPTAFDSQPSHLTFLTTLRPFISLYKLLVTPVVVLLSHHNPSAFLSELVPNEGEVDYIFHHPLEAILAPDPTVIPALDVEREMFSNIGGEDWPYETEWYVSNFDSSYLDKALRAGHRTLQILNGSLISHIECIDSVRLEPLSKDSHRTFW